MLLIVFLNLQDILTFAHKIYKGLNQRTLTPNFMKTGMQKQCIKMTLNRL